MNTLKSKKSLISLVVLILLIGVLAFYQVKMLERAHSTFENYYAFRGCEKLISRDEESGLCETKSGEQIRIVKFDNRWFLAGDLPCGFFCF